MTLARLNVRDDRSPDQLLADGDQRWPATTAPITEPPFAGWLYIPPHLTGKTRRGFMRSLLLAETAILAKADEDRRRDEFVRAGPGCICEQCKMVFADHPEDPHRQPLRILCSRARVKL